MDTNSNTNEKAERCPSQMAKEHLGYLLEARAAQQFLKWGYKFASEASEKNFLTPHFWLAWGDIKQDITVFITAIMTYKCLCLPAPND